MNFIPDEFYHIYNRGNNKQVIFFKEDNYLFFIKKIREQLMPASNVICYCLMPNHFHIIIHTNINSVHERPGFGGKPMQELSYRIGILLSSYTQAINKQNKTSGSLFQQKTKSKILSEQNDGKKESYLESCFFYIQNNPIRAKLVKKLTDWKYSSYLDYIEKRDGTLCNKEVFIKFTGLSKEDICKRSSNDFPESITGKFYC